jgi:DNA repair exonuclease SbcCD nuclease subunit
MNGLNASYFDNVDFGLFGHIHKRQTIKYEGIPLVYCGSLIQQDHGENMSSHGFLVWDTEEVSFSSVENENKEYGYYTFKIDDIEDIEMDDEEIINL